MMVRGKKYHPECVKCSTKGCKDTAKYIALDDNYCQAHMPVGAELSHRIDRKPTVSTPRSGGGGDDGGDVDSSPGRMSRPIAKRDIVKFNPRGPREQVEYDTTKKEYKQPSNPFASRDGKIGALPEVTPLPYTSTRPAAFQVPQRKIVSPKTQSQQESSSNDTSTDDSQQQQEDNDSSQSTPSKKKIQKKAKQTTIDDEPTPIGRVQAVPSVSDDNRPKIKEDPTKLFVEDDDEKDAKRGTPAAARKQRDALLDAKERLKDRLKDEPMPKGKKTYTVTVNPDGSAKTEQDLLEQKQREAAEKERRAKKKTR